jgi:hypothetical protein
MAPLACCTRTSVPLLRQHPVVGGGAFASPRSSRESGFARRAVPPVHTALAVSRRAHRGMASARGTLSCPTATTSWAARCQAGSAAVPLFDDPLVLAVPHSLAAPVRRDGLGALRESEWISAAAPSSCREILLHACRSAGFTPHITHTYEDLRAALVLVATGAAVTILPRLLCDAAARRHRHAAAARPWPDGRGPDAGGLGTAASPLQHSRRWRRWEAGVTPERPARRLYPVRKSSRW